MRFRSTVGRFNAPIKHGQLENSLSKCVLLSLSERVLRLFQACAKTEANYLMQTNVSSELCKISNICELRVPTRVMVLPCLLGTFYAAKFTAKFARLNKP